MILVLDLPWMIHNHPDFWAQLISPSHHGQNRDGCRCDRESRTGVAMTVEQNIRNMIDSGLHFWGPEAARLRMSGKPDAENGALLTTKAILDRIEDTRLPVTESLTRLRQEARDYLRGLNVLL